MRRFTSGLFHRILVVAMFVLSANQLFAVTTAEYVPSGFSSGSSVSGFNNGAFIPAQVFTPTISGTVNDISVGIWSTSANAVNVSLRSVSGGLPSSVLGTVTIPSATFASGNLYTADFTSLGINLNSGTQYAISLNTVSSSPNVAWSGDFINGYTGGDLATSNNSGSTWATAPGVDGVFRVTVTPVPEPSTWAAIALGMGLLGWTRLRRQ